MFNVRIPVLTACTLALGVLFGYLISFFKTNIVLLIAVIPLTAIVFLFCLILKKKKLLVISLILIATFSGGALNCYYTLQNYSVCDVDTEQVYLITGTVKEKGTATYGEYIIIGDATAYDEKLSGKVRVYLSERYGDFCDVGYRVQFYTKLKFNDAFPYGELNYYAEDNLKYTCTQYSHLTSTYHFSLSGSIRSRIKDVFYDNLDYGTASVCYAMMLGDTQNVDDDTLANFRYGGIAHVFAVSGLHIGIVYGILSFILKKIRVNKYVSAVIAITAITCYAWICGFSVSSVRAVIMCTVNILTKLIHVKSDGLNNLGFAGIIILLISPLSLFSVGFQLSFCAIIGLCFYRNAIKRNLKKIKCPAKVAAVISATFGAQAGTFPVTLAKFGYVSWAGLLLNILIVPLVSVFFTVLFAGTVLSLIIPPIAGFIMQNAALPLEALLSFLVLANFENAIIGGFGANVFAVIYFLVALFFSDKLNIKLLSKSVLATCGVAVLAICVLAQTYMPANGYKISAASYSNNGSVIIKSTQGTVLVMTESTPISRIKRNLNDEYSTNLDCVIILGDDTSATAYDLSLNCSHVYICSLYIPLQPFRTVEFHYEKDFSVCGVEFEYLDGHNIIAVADGVKLLISNSEEPPATDCDTVITMTEDYGKFKYYINNGKIKS